MPKIVQAIAKNFSLKKSRICRKHVKSCNLFRYIYSGLDKNYGRIVFFLAGSVNGLIAHDDNEDYSGNRTIVAISCDKAAAKALWAIALSILQHN